MNIENYPVTKNLVDAATLVGRGFIKERATCIFQKTDVPEIQKLLKIVREKVQGIILNVQNPEKQDSSSIIPEVVVFGIQKADKFAEKPKKRVLRTLFEEGNKKVKRKGKNKGPK